MNKTDATGKSPGLFNLFEVAVLETKRRMWKERLTGYSENTNVDNSNFSFVSATVLVVAALIYAGNVYRHHLERWDDAFITFRFAQHLANGQGLIWNIGGEPVEGFTSFLHVLLLAAGFKLGVDPWTGSLIISMVSVAATAALMLAIVVRQTGKIQPIAAIAIGFYLIDVNTALHTTSGLETQLFVLLLCAAYYFAFRFIESPGWQSAIGLSTTVFFSCLTRPEAVIYGFGVYFALATFYLNPVHWNREKKEGFLKLGTAAFLVLIGGLIYAAWKYSYFGYLLPNPYYVKSSKFSLAGLPEVAEFLKHLVKWFAPLATTAFLIFLLGESQTPRLSVKSQSSAADFSPSVADRKTRAKLLLTLIPPLLALGYYSTIIHEVGGAFRFSYPTYFYFVLICAVFMPLLFDSVKVSRFNQIFLITAGLIVFGVMFISQKSWIVSPVPPGPFNQYHTKIAEALQSTQLGSKATILCDGAGIIPYTSGFNQIDRVGLTDNFLSGRKPATPEEREAYIWSRPLDVYVGYEPPAEIGAERPEDDARMQTQYVSQILLKKKLTLIESRIFEQEPALLHARMRELRDGWILVGEIKWAGWDAWRLKSFVYVRRDSPYAEQLNSKLKSIVALAPNQINLNDINKR
jgi:arabinofuranosyltransferase